MPYIKKELRPNLDIAIDELVTRIKNTTENDDTLVSGVLNYCITRILLETLLRRIGAVKYNAMCMIDGVLSNIGREIYRRVTGPYEDQKIKDPKGGEVKEFDQINRMLFPGDYQ